VTVGLFVMIDLFSQNFVYLYFVYIWALALYSGGNPFSSGPLVLIVIFRTFLRYVWRIPKQCLEQRPLLSLGNVYVP
jgi:hypothetical protein